MMMLVRSGVSSPRETDQFREALYLSDPDRNQIAVLNLQTGQVTQAGQGGKNPGQFAAPLGIATGTDGKIYVLDSDNARVQVFGSLGTK